MCNRAELRTHTGDCIFYFFSNSNVDSSTSLYDLELLRLLGSNHITWQLTFTVLSCVAFRTRTFILQMICEDHAFQQRSIIVCSIYAAASVYTRIWRTCTLGVCEGRTKYKVVFSWEQPLLNLRAVKPRGEWRVESLSHPAVRFRSFAATTSNNNNNNNKSLLKPNGFHL